MKKRIIFTVTNNLSYDQRMQRICRSLYKAGYEVWLVGRQTPNAAALAPAPYVQKRLYCLFSKGKLFYIEYNLRLLFFLLFKRFNAVCAIDLDTIVPAYFAGRLKGARLVYDAHEYFTEVPEVIRRPRIKKTWQWVEKNFATRFHLIYTVSPALAQLFAAMLNKQVHTILNVPEESAPANAGSGHYILYQGALNEGRGLEFLIEAMQHVNGKLKLAGEGDLSATLRQQVQQLRLQDKVEFLGYVAPNRLKAITADAAVGVNLLENKGLSYYYSLSNKFFDYIQARIPQVCIAFPEYKAINEKYGVAVLVESCTVNEIKTALQRLMEDRELALRLQKNCEVCSRVLNWHQEEKKLLALYEQLFR